MMGVPYPLLYGESQTGKSSSVKCALSLMGMDNNMRTRLKAPKSIPIITANALPAADK